MSRVLPKELRTKKVNSLDGELRDMAEELLAEKFGIAEEVVREKSPDRFQAGVSAYAPHKHGTTYGVGGTYGHHYVKPVEQQSDIWVTTDPLRRQRRASIKINEPKLQYIANAIDEFAKEGIPLTGATLTMDSEFYRQLEVEVPHFPPGRGMHPKIMGITTRISPHIYRCVLESEY